MSMLEQAAEEVAKSVRAMVSTSKEDSKNSETARQALLDSISKLQQLALRPDEALTQMVVQHQQLASIYWLSHFGIPALIPASPQSAGYADVAAAAKVPEKRLISIARMAMTANFLAETDAGQLVHTELSEAFVEADSHYRNWMTFVVRRVVPAMHKMVEATEKWSETNTGNQTAYTLAMDTDKSFFEHINSTPELAKEIGGYMRSRSVITPQSGVDGLIENFDWKSLGNGLVVDVGGGDGEIAIGLAEEFPDLKFVVQDLPRFIDQGKEIAKKLPSSIASRVELQAHDFFNDQPVKGADVYLFRGVFHNWGKEDGAKLLKKTIAAMKPDSKIIVVDMVLLAPGSLPAYVEGMQREKDLTMMQLLNAGERQWEDWQSLLEDGGMKVHSINRPSGKRESVMVAVFDKSVNGSG
ncbi:S-adenosyl-L-methionine-dependent methyltransferase [Pestalotiopsis sp. NC0098]|nr:S-adenosyl-L-methionine-dependent methyltransferase [Pestalotiopsis sp. NC0098]